MVAQHKSADKYVNILWSQKHFLISAANPVKILQHPRQRRRNEKTKGEVLVIDSRVAGSSDTHQIHIPLIAA